MDVHIHTYIYTSAANSGSQNKSVLSMFHSWKPTRRCINPIRKKVCKTPNCAGRTLKARLRLKLRENKVKSATLSIHVCFLLGLCKKHWELRKHGMLWWGSLQSNFPRTCPLSIYRKQWTIWWPFHTLTLSYRGWDTFIHSDIWNFGSFKTFDKSTIIPW